MGRRAAIAGGVALLALVSLAYLLSLPPAAAPERPPGVPEDAIWAGSSSGDWIRCIREAGEGIFACEIYAEQGEKIHSGRYRWDGSQPPPRSPALRYWDGESILARDGRLLPIGRHTDYFSDEESRVTEFPNGT